MALPGGTFEGRTADAALTLEDNMGQVTVVEPDVTVIEVPPSCAGSESEFA
jgi:spermidine synthase